MSLVDNTTHSLARSLDMRLLRNSVVNANIANAETPGYHARKVDFEDALAKAIVDSQIQHDGETRIMNVSPDVYDNPDININPDGNTVDLEKEMSTLAENTIMYRAAVELINKKLAALKYAAQEGGR